MLQIRHQWGFEELPVSSNWATLDYCIPRELKGAAFSFSVAPGGCVLGHSEFVDLASAQLVTDMDCP